MLKTYGSLVYSHYGYVVEVDLLCFLFSRYPQQLKKSTMRAIKGPKPPDPEPAGYQAPPAPPVKKIWSAQRRKITPKVGQLTDDPNEIRRIASDFLKYYEHP